MLVVDFHACNGVVSEIESIRKSDLFNIVLSVSSGGVISGGNWCFFRFGLLNLGYIFGRPRDQLMLGFDGEELALIDIFNIFEEIIKAN